MTEQTFQERNDLAGKALDEADAEAGITRPTHYTIGALTIRHATGEAHIQCPLCPSKLANAAGTVFGLVEAFKDHLADEHDAIDCTHCGEAVEIDGVGDWFHSDTGSDQCWHGKDFHATPETP